MATRAGGLITGANVVSSVLNTGVAPGTRFNVPSGDQAVLDGGVGALTVTALPTATRVTVAGDANAANNMTSVNYGGARRDTCKYGHARGRRL